MTERWDAVVVGSGPNGLAAAITLAQAGWRVLVLERSAAPGGGCRTAPLTLPGFLHDVCSAIHPMAVSSPFFQKLELGLDWVQPEIPFAHPVDDEHAVACFRSVEETARQFGRDEGTYRRLMGTLSETYGQWTPALLERTWLPRHPLLLARFGLQAMRTSRGFAKSVFREATARALFAGAAAHVIGSFAAPFTASMGLLMMLTAHAVGWPFPRGGAQQIVDALVARLRSLGGTLELDREVRSLEDVPEAKVVLFDITPRQLLRIAGEALSPSYREALGRFRQGPGVFKFDYALSAPIPWRADICRRAGTVHVGGGFDEVDLAEETAVRGRVSERPFLLVAQPSLWDVSRAPVNQHTAWVYCHVPHGSNQDMTPQVEAQLERFAPGFRDCVLARRTMSPRELEAYNPNYVGGDIAGGSHAGLQLLMRPVPAWNPYRTSNPRLYLCSASTPPGAGVHGMCGENAARTALRDHRAGV